MGIRKRARRAIYWGAVLLLTSLAGGLWFAYTYVTDSNTLAALIRAEAPRYLPGSRLDLARVSVHPFVGVIELTRVNVRQSLDGAPFLAASVPWMKIRYDARAMLRRRRFAPGEVVVAQPMLRLRRRKDGTWNLRGLLADPWPGPPMKGTPPITIQNGTVELSDGDGEAREVAAILRDVTARIEPAGGDGDRLRFEGTAKGDVFDRLALRGTIDRATGRVELEGDLARLVISETLRKRLPPDWRPAVDQAGLTSGEVDLRIGRLSYDPAARPAVRYEGTAQLRSGVCTCRKLPFPLSDVSAAASARDGVLAIERAEGYNGPTTVRVEKGLIGLDDPARGPLDLHVDIVGLELDDRLRRRTPPELAGLWDEFAPSGRVSVALDVARGPDGRPTVTRSRTECLDVAMVYKYFKYPLDHVRGWIVREGSRVRLDLRTVVGNKPMSASGTIDDPGPDAHVVLDFRGEALPIDRTLLDAMPPDVRAVVDQFHPTGTVQGEAHVERTPPRSPSEPPEGTVVIDAVLDLNERCAIRWDGLPYPIENLTGRLEVHPDLWTFQRHARRQRPGGHHRQRDGQEAPRPRRPPRRRPAPERRAAPVRRPAPRGAAGRLADGLDGAQPGRVERRRRPDQGAAGAARRLPGEDRPRGPRRPSGSNSAATRSRGSTPAARSSCGWRTSRAGSSTTTARSGCATSASCSTARRSSSSRGPSAWRAAAGSSCGSPSCGPATSGSTRRCARSCRR